MLKYLCLGLWAFSLTQAETIHLTGQWVNAASNPVAGAVVQLKHEAGTLNYGRIMRFGFPGRIYLYSVGNLNPVLIPW